MKLDKMFFFEISRSCKIYLSHKNRSKENANSRKSLCFDIVTEKRFYDCCSQRYWGLKRDIFFSLKRSAALLPPGMIPKRKSCSDAAKNTSPRTEKLLKHKVPSSPSTTAVELKNKDHEILHNVSTRTLCHRLRKDVGLPGRGAGKKPMVTAAMKKKRLNFYQKYRHWTAARGRKVMFSDESTFTLVRGVPKIVRRPSSAS